MKPVDPRLLRSADRVAMAATAAAGVVAGGLVLVQAGLLASLVAGAVAGTPAHELTPRAVAMAGVFLARGLLSWAQEVLGQRAATAAKSRLRRQVMAATLERAGQDGDQQRRSAALTVAVDGLDALDPYFARYLPHLLGTAIVPLLVVVQLTLLDITSAVTVALTLPLIPVFMVLVGRLTEGVNRRRLSTLERLSHHFLDVVEGMTTLRLFGRGDAQRDLVRATSDHYRTATMGTLRVAFLSSLVLETIATISVALVAVSVGLRLVDGQLGLRTGLFVILLAPEAYLPLRQVGVHFHSSAAGLAAGEAAFALIDARAATTVAADVSGAAATQPTAIGRAGRVSVHLRGVSVRHPQRDRLAPNDLHLSVGPGEIVGIAGASGAGKTTALAVILGLRTPDAGGARAVLDGVETDLAALDTSTWHLHVAWVDQHPFVIEGSIADNLAMAAPDASISDMNAALARAGLHIALDRVVRSTSLSAGERRRLALARALVRAAPLLVLDEPTAGLDAATEAVVLAAVTAEAARGAAVVIASHHPATLAIAHTVVRL